MEHPVDWADARVDADRLAHLASRMDEWIGDVRPGAVAELADSSIEQMESLAHKLNLLLAQAHHLRGERSRA